MKKAILIRFDSSDQGTFGVLRSEMFSVYIAELEWNKNRRQISCIPAGSYACKWLRSKKFGWCYHLSNVPGRSSILIHKGNFVGSTAAGYKTNSHGCLLPAMRLGKLAGQRAGLLSLPATMKLNEYFNQQDFQLEIINAYSNPSTPKQ